MKQYSGIREIKVLSDPDRVNELLADCWELLEIYKTEDGVMFVVGRDFYKSFGELCPYFAYEGTA